ncbi:sodium-coupled monocarboxylate transporter 1-like [Diabrotica virgifera virgifera]|uniref:Sodium-coupled monocarboxylate transporter 1-like n=1 Tax=Diabrotica virgifera virgifera TaxID=50390 RepID=A0A6P7GHQ4_DIAVI|nr:sodium-coupled monocarboxylate transporter 1-like [Diabrotica virgifera virgifera]XP_028145398.1 sodium-coupled monocarboxylate transporter 1-like [Diabrotica virgifera virgifera]XP_028145399.1 sodium-coupled monocarboxylate transporter 1-like [Diabrotica virgifera virgifera]XP_028145400.1 sodium-coupled monocarboxylate transporter 1-like [Diabrotica virgifera virgifera]
MARESKELIWDYLIFVFMIVATTSFAIYSKFCGAKEKTKADYVFAVGKVSIFNMMLSIARGNLGVRSIIGYPAELFYRGATMWESLYGTLLAYPIVCFVFVPMYFNLGITSVYQYLDLRFKSRLVRCLASGTFILRQFLLQGVTVFTPCVALKAVCGLPYWVSICGIGAISMVFNILGGLKAAIWVDALQSVITILVSVAIIICGALEAGGIGRVIEINKMDGRLEFFNFDPDPTVRVTTISAVFGNLFMSLSILGCQQSFVQRYLSMGSQQQVTKVLMYNIPVITVLFSLAWVVGMVIYAVYENCDPLSYGYIKNLDEILPFYVGDRFSFFPGLLGLFMATLFNGALSLNVSIINSLATVTYEDFLKPIPAFKGLKDYYELWTIKFISVAYGFIIIGMSFLVSMIDGVIEASMLVTSVTSGPLLGVFLLAMLIPVANGKGAAFGIILGHLVTFWIAIGAFIIDKPPTPYLPLNTDGCNETFFSDHVKRPSDISFNVTTFNLVKNSYTETIQEEVSNNKNPLYLLYSVTYMYYTCIGCLITVLVGTLVSYITKSKLDNCDEDLIHPWIWRMKNLCRRGKSFELQNINDKKTKNDNVN